ncbi:MAG: hypothetical protein CMQ16_08915 [Gammaproteobacteria bacterium]|nr:hypothetical protein [Gammaproteobacteria bacterium]
MQWKSALLSKRADFFYPKIETSPCPFLPAGAAFYSGKLLWFSDRIHESLSEVSALSSQTRSQTP